MKFTIQNLLLTGLVFLSFSVQETYAQKAPECVKVAKASRPNWLLLKKTDLDRFYKNFEEGITFKNMKLVKSELSYYLIAFENNGDRVFAFELEQKGKKLFLNKYLPVQTCDEGELSLDTFLQKDGKIVGCKLAKHTIQQKTKEEKRKKQ